MLKTILSRRSIRQYRDEALLDSDIEELLQAAMSAPSAGNQQPWHFVVIHERLVLQAISALHPYAGMVATAAAAILVCGDPALEIYPGYWVQDCSAATQNILLAAHAKGLGAVWCGIHPRNEREQALRLLLEIPEAVIPFSLVALGHPAESHPPADRYDVGRVHNGRW